MAIRELVKHNIAAIIHLIEQVPECFACNMWLIKPYSSHRDRERLPAKKRAKLKMKKNAKKKEQTPLRIKFPKFQPKLVSLNHKYL